MNAAWIVLLAYLVSAVTILVPLGMYIEHWLERRRLRREFLRSIIWKV
jgi:hypothetical protein